MSPLLLCCGWRCVGVRLALALALALVFVASTKGEAEGVGKSQTTFSGVSNSA